MVNDDEDEAEHVLNNERTRWYYCRDATEVSNLPQMLLVMALLSVGDESESHGGRWNNRGRVMIHVVMSDLCTNGGDHCFTLLSGSCFRLRYPR